MVVVKELAAELQVQLAAHLSHPIENGLTLLSQIAFVVECASVLSVFGHGTSRTILTNGRIAGTSQKG